MLPRTHSANITSMFVRAIIGWFAILAVAILNGGIRDAYIRPRFGFFAAEVYGASILSLAVIIAAGFVMRPVAKPNWKKDALRLSAFWLVLTLGFEFLFFHYVGGRTWSELFAAYRFWEGRLWTVVVLVVAIAPFVVGRWKATERLVSR
jgi:NhaP-type Na+/H+ or K+/H+ antiporter